MAERDESPHPLAPPETYPRSDQEYSNMTEELRRKKRRKRMAYNAAFAVLLIILVLVLAIVIVRFKAPKFRLRHASFTSFRVGNATNPSFNFVLNAQFTVKNTNWGKFEYDYGTVGFEYRGVAVGHANIDDARVRARTTKKVNTSVALSSDGLASNSEELGSDIGSGVLGLRANSKLEGKIKVLKVIKKNKSALLNCTMDVHIAAQTINNIKCN
ncbi:hypothetical protein FNV43_RR24015 [Rhamnella rubrinervis]|uniref:Late embryogenesis abundant protein LEA-2 subgroup domain-containing protein n=1 Tax=Rhamnella rubrinervis TaxID=2594499 RepID=A0A8K0GQC3_9ROSA|nr:hypothetical protein FNV43_RR24015 [Rhamnella rubrinervis]